MSAISTDSYSFVDVDDQPVTIALHPQPIPLAAIVSELPHTSGITAAITRVWAPGDTYRCRLCEKCAALHQFGVCQVQVDRSVDLDSASLLSTRDTFVHVYDRRAAGGLTAGGNRA